MTMSSHARRAHWLWVGLLGVYAAAAAVGITGWRAGYQLGLSAGFDDGITTVTSVFPGGLAWEAGVRPGDRLVEVRGRAPDPEEWRLRRDAGSDFVVVSAGTGEIITQADVELPQVGPVGVAGLVLLSVSFVAVSAVVFLRARRTLAATRFAFFGLIAASALVLVPGTVNWRAPALTLEALLVHWIPVAFVAFCFAFGAGIQSWRRKSLLICMFAIAAVLNGLWVVMLLVIPNLHGLARSLDIGFLSAGVVAGILGALFSYRAAAAPEDKERLRIVLTGTVLGLLPVLLLSLLPAIAEYGHGIDAEFTAFGTVLIPLSFGYAFFRSELRGVRKAVHRGVAYAVITVGAVLIYGIAVSTLDRLLGPESDFTRPAEVGLVIAMIVGVPMAPAIRRGAGAIVDRVLYPGPPDYARVIQQLTQEAASAEQRQLLLDETTEGLRAGLRLSFAAFFEAAPSGHEVRSSSGLSAQAFAEQAQYVVTRSRPEGTRPEVIQAADGTLMMAVNIKGRGGQRNVLVLGPRDTDELFNAEDERLVATVSNLLSTAMSRIELIEELQRQATELWQTNTLLLNLQERERAEIAGFLHDAPLQRVARVLAEARQGGLRADLLKTMEEAVSELRMISSTLSPSILENLGLVRSVEALGRDLETSTGIKVAFSYGGILRHERLPADVELAGYRIVQEALNNARKHSHASTVWVTLETLPGELSLTVADDGGGLSADYTPGFGLRSMRVRAEQLGGNLLVSSEPGRRGTTIVAAIPLSPDDHRDGA